MKRYAYKRIAAPLALLFALFAVFASGCGSLSSLPGAQTQIPGTADPNAAQTPDELTPTPPLGVTPEGGDMEVLLTEADGVAFVQKTVLYPEDATEANAQFRLEYALPAFGEAFPAAAAMNEQVALYEDELLERVRAERLPYADTAAGGALPYTRVECRIERAGGYINIYLHEFTSFCGEEEALPRILVIGPDGARASLASATGVYDVEPLAAQQVFNLIDANRGAYFGDITLEDIPAALDLYAGFFVTGEGYGLAIAPGTLAPEEEGMLVFLIDRAAFYPEAVGSVLLAAEYEALRAPLDALVSACAMDYAGFDASAPNAFVTTSFLTLLLTQGTEDALYAPVPRAQYEEAYASYFSAPLPANWAEAGDGTWLDGESYMLPVYAHGTWSLRIDQAVRTQTGLVLYGMILYGVPGTASAGELTAATVTLTASGVSPAGYIFESVELR